MNFISNIKWVAVSQIVKIMVQIISITVLARLLEPKEYGLMSMAAIITNFAVIIRDVGTSAAIIQKKIINYKMKSTIFWLNILIGVFIFFVIVISARKIAIFFHTSELTSVLYCLAITFPIASSGSTHQALMERNSKFRSIAGIEIRSATASLVVALIMAYCGFGVYSLVFQSLVLSILSTIQFWLFLNWRPKFVFDNDILRQLIGFSGNLTCFNIVNYFSRNMDSVIIGHYFTSVILGTYSLAYRIMLFPVQNLTFIISRSLFPVMSRNQGNIEEVREVYTKIITVIASITAPAMFALLILREPITDIVFGSKWSGLAPLLLWLAPTGFIQSIVSTSGSVFMANNKTNLLLKLGLYGALLQISAFYFGAKYSIGVLSMFYFFANIINSIPVLHFSISTLNGNLIHILKCLIAPLFSTIGMALYLSVYVNYFYDINDLKLFLFFCLSSIVIYLIIYRSIFPGTFKVVCPPVFQKIFSL